MTLQLAHLDDPDPGSSWFVIEMLRTSATLLTSAWAVSWIVGPLVNCAQLWREIGQREALEQSRAGRCKCGQPNNIIPITYVGELARAKRP